MPTQVQTVGWATRVVVLVVVSLTLLAGPLYVVQ